MLLRVLESSKKWMGKKLAGASDENGPIKEIIPPPGPNPPKLNNPPKVSDSKSKSNNKPASKSRLG